MLHNGNFVHMRDQLALASLAVIKTMMPLLLTHNVCFRFRAFFKITGTVH